MDGRAYRRLEVWQQAMLLVEMVYPLARRLPGTEKFGLTSQIQRAAVSIPANIAEGYGRMHRGDYVRHLSIARGSLMEVETFLILLVRLQMRKREDVIPAWDLAQQVGKMLTQLIRSLQPSAAAAGCDQTPDPRPQTLP